MSSSYGRVLSMGCSRWIIRSLNLERQWKIEVTEKRTVQMK